MAQTNTPSNSNKTCLWKKVLSNPDNTTTKDSLLSQIEKCRSCPAYSEHLAPTPCSEYLETD